jgi:hypothetical protein
VPCEFLEVAAIQETALPFHFYPHGWAADPYLYR